ncbi:MAG: glycosyltransferase family 2 protein [Patescibacteria group bacterium]|nr:glycosyltransferase family 2 protein [Patescibacteria group bacterium]
MVSVIIVTYNSGLHIRRCLNALHESAALLGEIIVVDNASTDDSATLVRQHFPQVHLIVNVENRGFAAAANLGFRASQGSTIFLLNPDTVANAAAVRHMADLLIHDTKIAAVGCQLRNLDDTIQPSAGRFPTIANLTVNRTPILKYLLPSYCDFRRSYYRRPQTPDWLSGACLMVQRRAFQSVGGFDEKYFMYGEDVDLCYRLRRTGWHIAYTPTAHVMHADEGKTAAKKIDKFINLRRGLLRFYRQHYPPSALTRFRVVLHTELFFRRLTSTQPAHRQAYRDLIAELSSTP